MTDYVSADQIIALNARLGGGVRDANGIAAAADRPSAEFSGIELYTDIWSKAAALLHGIASTQNFLDGNKRTAWVATLFFLRINGEDLRALPRIARESFVLTVATGLFSLEQIAEWLKENRSRAADLLDFAFIARDANFNNEEPSTWDATGCSIGGLNAGVLPAIFYVYVVCRIKWRTADVGVVPDLKLTIHTIDGGSGPAADVLDVRQFEEGTVDFMRPDLAPIAQDVELRTEAPIHTGHPHHANGVMPVICIYPIPLLLHRRGMTRMVIRLAGEPLASIPFTVERLPDQTSHDAIAQYLRKFNK